MKTINYLFLLLLSIAHSAFGQSATGTITQQPCNNDGIYTVTTSGLSTPLTYTYYFNSGAPIVHSNVNSTTDQLTNFAMNNNGYIYCYVTNGNASASTQNSYTPAFTFNASGTSPNCPATMGTLTATQTSGTGGPFTYVWTENQSMQTFLGNNVNAPVGAYSLEITDQTTGCVLKISDTAVYINQISNINAAISTTPANCTNGSATAVANGGTAPYTYQWANGATTSTITGLSKGYYHLTVYDSQGCYSNNMYLGANITQTPQINVNTSVTNATCAQSDGSAIAFGQGGTSPYSYSWSNGQSTNTANNLTGGNYYTVIATDANGCFGQGYANITSTTPINVTYTSTNSQCTSPTGAATLTVTGGTAPYNYYWNASQAANSPTLSNVTSGAYSFQVSDAAGCVRNGSVIINSASTIYASAYGETIQCPNTTGSAGVNVSGSNGPFTFLWNNGATTQQISGAPLGNYSCEIMDAAGCTVTKYTSIQSTSPVHVAISTTPVSCKFTNDGSALSTVSGGVGPYTYSYSNGSTNSTASNLGVGNHYLTVTDANGCSTTKHFVITNSNTSNSCYCTISGYVYVDGNADCNYDLGETGIENIMVHCSGFGYTFTDANGYYSFQVPSGTYTISEQINGYYPLAACQSNSTSVTVVAASGCSTVVNIANDMSALHDLKIVTVNANHPPIPGNNYQQKVIVKNEGTINESTIQLGYQHDGQLPYLNSSLVSLTQPNSTTHPNYYNVQSGFPTLSPGQSSVILINYDTPTNIPLGTNLVFYDSVADQGPIQDNWVLDYSPWNNVNTYNTTVIGSYDPNYKEVSPKGLGAPGYISSATTEFDYTIHFQNEGTYFAQNIVVTDQLDADLDWSTLKPGYSDYSYTTNVSETGLVTFTFANINLPWKSQYGDPMSSAFINYSIKRKANNPQGTEFTNYADIYFDYNAPITTNTTINTLDDAMADLDDEVKMEVNSNDLTIDLYPVPAKDYLNVRINNISKNEKATFAIIDIMGNTLLTDNIELNEGSTEFTQNISNLTRGTYLTRIQLTDGTMIIKKIVVN